MTVNRKLLILLALIAATVLFGELKYVPFHSEFRISFGSAVFFFLLLWLQDTPIPLASALAGGAVVLFRVWLDYILAPGSFNVWASLLTHLPSLTFYLTFGFVLTAGRVRRYLNIPLVLGLIGFSADFLANLTELFVRKSLAAGASLFPFEPREDYLLFILAFVRSFFVVGFFNMIQIGHLREISREQRLRFEKLLLISSDLHMESLYLKKVMGHIEQVTRDGYNLYRDLKPLEKHGQLPQADPPLSMRALSIAEEVHEIKKDSQRILSGVSRIIEQETVVDQMTIKEIVALAIGANKKYAEMLEKNITFTSAVHTYLVTDKIYALLSVINNLLSNAVEAIEQQGEISVRVQQEKENLTFRISDSGGGIAGGDKPYIFIPGYTTKYDSKGNPSTGIGLAHALQIVNEYGGKLEVEQGQPPECTIFVICISAAALQKEKG
jgi:two-component system, sensor histidine kinase YcbA